MNTNFFQLGLQKINSISITGIQPVSSELLHLSVSHLFSLFNLLWSQLNLTWIHSCVCSSIYISIWFEIVWIHVTIIIRISLWWLPLNWFSSTSSSVLLCNSTFELIHRNLFKLFPHDFFFSEPSVFCLTIFSPICIAISWTWSLWMATFCLC